MLDGRLFDKLEAVSRRIRGDDRCFGGIQVIVSGDFFQLPPVGLGKNGVIYCFESASWNAVIQVKRRKKAGEAKKSVVMHRVFRQKDPALQALLRDIRFVSTFPRFDNAQGHVSASSRGLLQRLERASLPRGPVLPTKLFAFNDAVDAYNAEALAQLPAGEAFEFRARDEGVDLYLRQLQKNCQAPAVLVLKPGAQVMLLKNLDVEAGLVNGSRGVVETFVETFGFGEKEAAFLAVFLPVTALRAALPRFKMEFQGSPRCVQAEMASHVIGCCAMLRSLMGRSDKREPRQKLELFERLLESCVLMAAENGSANVVGSVVVSYMVIQFYNESIRQHVFIPSEEVIRILSMSDNASVVDGCMQFVLKYAERGEVKSSFLQADERKGRSVEMEGIVRNSLNKERLLSNMVRVERVCHL